MQSVYGGVNNWLTDVAARRQYIMKSSREEIERGVCNHVLCLFSFHGCIQHQNGGIVMY